jgi:hypothetical protein
LPVPKGDRQYFILILFEKTSQVFSL